MIKKLILILLLFSIYSSFGCTIGVINGSATIDGRPIIWKSREAGNNVQVFHEDSYTYEYTGSGNSGSEYVWMGMNETGLAIANAMVGDLERLPGNGDCMLQALRYYSTIDEFLAFLDSTNVTGRETHTNYVVMDATGAAVVLEVGTTEYWLYDTADTEYGFLVRDNFSFAGGGTSSNKYELMNQVLSDLAQAGPINWQELFPTLITGFYDEEHEPVQVPFAGRWDIDEHYGYINTSYSNSGLSNSSVALMHGATPNEPAWLSTMWTMLGTPTCSIALPYWAVCPEVPGPASGNPAVPLTDRATQIRQLVYNATPSSYADSYMLSNDDQNGYWDTVQPFMQEKFALVTQLREQWIGNQPTINELQTWQSSICTEGYDLVMDWNLEPVVTADFEADIIQGEAPFTVHFADKSRHAPDSLGWSFDGDDTIEAIMTDSLGLGIDWVYEEPGEYSVTLIAARDDMVDTCTRENYIIVNYPDVDYLAASLDTVVCDYDDDINEEITIYNIGDFPVELQDIHFTTLEGYPHPEEVLFFWDFIDEDELPLEIVPGDSCRLLIIPELLCREYWGETLVIEADLDTLNVPCLYDEDIWYNGDEDEDVIEPEALTLSNYPNPFNPSTSIAFYLPQAGKVNLSIYNLKGQKVITLAEKCFEKGSNSITWNGKDESGDYASSAIYIIKLDANQKNKISRKCLLLK